MNTESVLEFHPITPYGEYGEYGCEVYRGNTYIGYVWASDRGGDLNNILTENEKNLIPSKTTIILHWHTKVVITGRQV